MGDYSSFLLEVSRFRPLKHVIAAAFVLIGLKVMAVICAKDCSRQ